MLDSYVIHIVVCVHALDTTTCVVIQVDSFIPLWEWDLPKKKSKKKGDKKEKGKAVLTNGDGTFI